MVKKIALTPEACRAGRALLKWGVRDLAAEADVSPNTVFLIESEKPFKAETGEKIIAAFTANGVEITNGERPGAFLLRREKAKPEKRAATKKPSSKR